MFEYFLLMMTGLKWLIFESKYISRYLCDQIYEKQQKQTKTRKTKNRNKNETNKQKTPLKLNLRTTCFQTPPQQ